jgi:uncharacterized protein
MPKLRPICGEDLDDLATGCWILGAGGGGEPYYSVLEMKGLYAAGRRVSLMDPLDLADDALVACVGQMGAPLVIQEKLTDGPVMAETVRMMERFIGRRFDAIMVWEVGGNNCFQPFLAGALLDLPVVDADAMGRAFPQADMTTFAICDLSAHPWTMVDIRRNSIIFAEAEGWSWMERMTRKACTVFGSVAATCKAPRLGHEVKSSTCLHTVSKALRIGAAVREARRAHRDPIAAVIEMEGGMILFRGKVSDVMRRTTEGFLRGNLAIEGIDADRGRVFTLDFQNEFAIGWLDGEVRVTVPDLICVMDTLSGDAIGTETVRFGQRVTVIALPAPAILLSEKALRHVGPRAFGHDVEFRSVFATGTR